MGYVNFGSVTAIGLIFPITGMIALGMRFYGRLKFVRSIELDDLLIVPAAVLNVLAGVAMVIGAQMKFLGGHTPNQSFGDFLHVVEERQIMLEKLEYAYWIGHVLAIGFIKLTFLFFYRRIFMGRGYRTVFDYVNWTLIVVVIVWTIAYTFLDIFFCGTHFSAAWSSVYALRTYCMDTFALLTSCAITSFAMDIAILLVPLVMVNSLNMSWKRKMQASLVFALGSFSVIAGLLRMIVLIQVLENSLQSPKITLLADTFATSDDEAVVSLVLFWTYMEIGVGFLVVCLVACGRVLDELTAPVLAKLKSVASAASSLASRTSSKSSLFSSDGTRTEKEETRIDVSTQVEVKTEHDRASPAVPEWLAASRRNGHVDVEAV